MKAKSSRFLRVPTLGRERPYRHHRCGSICPVLGVELPFLGSMTFEKPGMGMKSTLTHPGRIAILCLSRADREIPVTAGQAERFGPFLHSGALLSLAPPQALHRLLLLLPDGIRQIDELPNHAGLSRMKLTEAPLQGSQHQVDLGMGVGIEHELAVRDLGGAAQGSLFGARQSKPFNQLVDELRSRRPLESHLQCRDVGLVVPDQLSELVLPDAVAHPQLVEVVGEGAHGAGERMWDDP